MDNFASKLVALSSVTEITISDELMLKFLEPLRVAWESCVGAVQEFLQQAGIANLTGLTAIFPAVSSDENDEKKIAGIMEAMLSWSPEKLQSLADRANAFRLCLGTPALFQNIATALLVLTLLLPGLMHVARLRQNASVWFHFPTLEEAMADPKHPLTGLTFIHNAVDEPTSLLVALRSCLESVQEFMIDARTSHYLEFVSCAPPSTTPALEDANKEDVGAEVDNAPFHIAKRAKQTFGLW